MSSPQSVNYLLQDFAPKQSFDVMIKGLTLDSRQVEDDFAFVALKGTKAHGMQYADTAIANGASAVIFETTDDLDINISANAKLFPVDDLSQKISAIASKFYAWPSEQLKVFAVTGTNGKSTIVYGLANILNKLEHKATVIGTVGFDVGQGLETPTHTTPDAINLQRLLAKASKNQSQVFLMEASSHGLAQYRLDGVKLDTAIYTNLSRDHQDFHPSMEHYAKSKERLLQMPELKNALVNISNKFGSLLAEEYKNKLNLVVYGVEIGDSHVTKYLNATGLELHENGLSFELASSWGKTNVKAQVFGKFNVENLLAIIGACLLVGEDLNKVVSEIENLQMVAGRMQSFKTDNSPLVVVDYAHTPDALVKALAALREHIGVRAEILCVFGCGGDRDKGKRPMMGAAVESHADLAIITDDNPRSEDSNAIIEDILAGFIKPQLAKIIPDRKQAILYAIDKASTKDVVLVAGKGHETQQIIGDKPLHFNDGEVVQEALC